MSGAHSCHRRVSCRNVSVADLQQKRTSFFDAHGAFSSQATPTRAAPRYGPENREKTGDMRHGLRALSQRESGVYGEVPMIVAVSLVMMLAATPSADPVGNGRKEFSKCLSAQMQPSLDKKLTVGDFQSAIKKACADKEAAFRAAIIAQDKADKMSDADASSDADDQISEYVDKITGEFEESSGPS
ncbi:hypothetical protein [Sphingobium sp.]|uniref:hypothetical protein n=1 Tax=Sphingobium sp. TaxID=1912891 RepID=UPI002C058794|nr:hypothetical protein [Sphingobium sp.]HUD93429.1 hypothetical protein [Sphingobium sp.]